MRERPGDDGRGVFVALIFTGLQALAFGDRFLLALLAAPVSHALGVDDLHMGLLQGTAFIIPFVVFTPVFGFLTDRFPRGWPLVAGLGISAAATAWAATADGFGALLGARMLLGVGEAAVAPAALVRIAAATGGRAGLAVGLFAAGGPIGKGLALTTGGALLAALTAAGGAVAPWREVLWVATGLNLLAAVAAWRVRPSSAHAAGPGDRPRTPAAAAADPRRLAAVAAGGIAAVLVSQTAAAWAPSLFARAFGLTAAQAGVVTGAPLLLLGPASGLAVGWALDRAAGGRAPPILSYVVACLAGAGALALGLAAAPGLAGAEALFSLLAVAGGAGAVAALRGVQLHAGHAVRARVVALYIAAANLVGFGVGPPLVGWLARPAGLRTALGAVLAGAAFIGAASAAALLAAGRSRAGSSARAAPAADAGALRPAQR